MGKPKSLETLWAVLKQMDRRYTERHTAQMEAIKKAEVATEKRFDSVNEFRGQLKDQTGSFVTRQELTSELAVLNTKIDSIKASADTGAGKSSGLEQSWAFFFSAGALVVAGIALFVR